MMSERRFPILAASQRIYPNYPEDIPWGFIEPHRKQAEANHGGQTLERLAERGGLDPLEILAIYSDMSMYPCNPEEAVETLDQLISDWRVLQQGGRLAHVK